MSAPTQAQLAALKRLWDMAQRDHGGANVAAKLLLGLYNGLRFPFDLTEFRRLDAAVMNDALQVLLMDWQPACEVHEHLNMLHGVRTMGKRFELLACRWKLKGRCTKEQEREIREQLAGVVTS